MSKNGILKSGWVVMNPADTRIIDSNALVENKLREMSLKLAEETMGDANFTDEFSVGLDPMQVVDLVSEEEMTPQEEYVPSKEDIMMEAKAEIESMKASALAQMEEMKAQILQKAKEEGYAAGFEQGKKEGYDKGHQEGLNSVAMERQAIQEELEQKERELEEVFQDRYESLEPKLVQTLTAIYEHIFQVSFKNSKDLVVHLLANTMRNLEGNHGYLIHVSKEDYPFVSMQKKEIIKGTNIAVEDIDLIEDVMLGKSECTIETGNGVFDCSLGTQLEALNEELRLLSYEPNKDEEGLN